jgi:hypothetical protein
MSITSLTTKILLGATVVAAGWVGTPAGTSHAAYNIGVKSLDFTPTLDWCLPGQWVPCTPGAGSGESNTLQVTQSVVDGYHQFNGLESTSAIDGSLWVGADIGAECRRGYKLFFAEISAGGTESDGMWREDEVVKSLFEVSVPNTRTMPVKRVAVELPIAETFSPTGAYGVPTTDDFFAYGEEVIADRVASGMSAAEARALPFQVVIPFSLNGSVVCRGTIGQHYKYEKSYTLPTTLTVEYLPVEVAAPSLDQAAPGGGLVADASVTDVELFVVQDPADPCTLHLSGSIHTNAPTNVEYRFINPNGQPSNTYNIAVDATQSVLIDRTVEVPRIDNPHASDDLAVLDAPSDLDDLYVDIPTDQYSGTYMLEVMSPNHMSDVDGFVVDYCDSISVAPVGGNRTGDLFVGSRPTHG